jgi:hypothetical protein
MNSMRWLLQSKLCCTICLSGHATVTLICSSFRLLTPWTCQSDSSQRSSLELVMRGLFMSPTRRTRYKQSCSRDWVTSAFSSRGPSCLSQKRWRPSVVTLGGPSRSLREQSKSVGMNIKRGHRRIWRKLVLTMWSRHTMRCPTRKLCRCSKVSENSKCS